MAVEKIIREPEYAKRLAQACDASPHCPPLHQGRLRWIVDECKRAGITLSNQSVARWLDGEAKPRQPKNDVIAKALGVDSVWLFLGVKPASRANSKGSASAANDTVAAIADAATGLLELLEEMGKGNRQAAKKMRAALERYERGT